MTSITSPVEGFTGKTSFGPLVVEFEDGKAEVEDLPDGIRAYLLRTGYKVGSRQGQTITTLDGNAIDEQPVDSRDIDSPQIVGTPLRDAAVDPRDGDFLAPVNAGEADPHGPDVVSPGIHASEGVRPVKGGEVHVDDTDAQDAAETAHTEAYLNAGTPEPEPDVELKGQALEDALEERGLAKTGSADEKRARLAEHDNAAKGQD